MIILIAALAENNALGKDNELIWHLPDDFKRFKQLTTGHHIIMGRKTFESFPKPLPNRTHIIISRQADYAATIPFTNCVVAGDIREAIAKSPKDQPTYIIGGGEIYKLALPLADRLELTRVHAVFEADAFFPEFNPEDWKLVHAEHHPKDEKHAYDFTYQTFDRK